MLVFYHWLILPQTPLQSILTIWQQSTSLSLTLSPGEPAGGALKLKCCVVLLADGAPRPPPAPFGVAGGAAAAANTVALAAAAALVERHWSLEAVMPGPVFFWLASASQILDPLASARCIARQRCLVVEPLDGGDHGGGSCMLLYGCPWPV